MVLQIHAQPIPITVNRDGVALVGETRVRLETVVAAFRRGESPEQIVDSFDVLTLADVYAVLGYYLYHREEVDTYIQQQIEAAGRIRREIETNKPEMFTLRNRFLKKKP